MAGVDPVKLAIPHVQRADMPGDEGLPSSLIENRSVDVGGKFFQRATTSSSQTICADSERREEAGPETVSHRVEHRELESAVVRGEVEGITGDVECRLQTARDMHTAVSIGRHRKQVPLHHRREPKMACPPGDLENVAVSPCSDHRGSDQGAERGRIRGHLRIVCLHTQSDDPDAVASLGHRKPEDWPS